jgi:hypothetical protein
MQVAGGSIRRIREAYSEAIGAPVWPEDFAAALALPADCERDGVSGSAALALRYLSQGLPDFRGALPEFCFQGLVGHHGPHKVLCRFWWPRFAAEIKWGHATTSIISQSTGSTIRANAAPESLRRPASSSFCDYQTPTGEGRMKRVE